MKNEVIRKIIEVARSENRKALLEPEGLQILKEMGINIPKYVFSKDIAEIIHFSEDLSTQKIVVKIVSPNILHKSDVGGVKIIDNESSLIEETISQMKQKFEKEDLCGFLVSEFIDYDSSLGGEILIGLRNTDDFGPVITFGPGGIYTEFLAKNFCQGSNISVFSPELLNDKVLSEGVSKIALSSLSFADFRGSPKRGDTENIKSIITNFAAFAKVFMPQEVSEFEVNPFALTKNGPIAVDILIKLQDKAFETPKERPISKIQNLLRPKTAAIIGVSEKMNMGRIILKNFLKEGFPREKLFVIKEGMTTIDDCKCYPDIASLPGKIDLLVVCVPATSVPDVIMDSISNNKFESLIIIPGGLEEKAGTNELVKKMKSAIQNSRDTESKGPVINGGNCLGIVSKPGHYDTLFIPDYKKSENSGEVAPLAFISQSGAFAVSRLSKLAEINPKYTITIGNQMDLTLGDYLTYLEEDREIKIFSIYLEGFKFNDGIKFLKAAKKILEAGRQIIFYASGKTAEGAKAMASHTASIAGDFAVTKELCEQIGITMAEDFAHFEELTKTFVFLKNKYVKGNRLSILSNAGCECVAASDSLGIFKLATFTEGTQKNLSQIFKNAKVDSIVDVHNPIDLTPMAGDEAYEASALAMMSDQNVDVGIVACIPLTPSLNALIKSNKHNEDLLEPASVVQRMISIVEKINKAWVAVVDAGYPFDPMVKLLEQNKIPTFRTIDRAMKVFGDFCKANLNKF